jgi:3-methylfumaryl-CoA hydratase
MPPDLRTWPNFREWIGRTEAADDTITPVPIAALSATLDRDDPPPKPGDPLPPLWHWLYFLPLHRQSKLAPDGHAERGAFIPPVPLPRRMWAGSRLTFHQPLHVGEPIRRTSVIADITQKTGRHQISGPTGLALTEEHDIVYRAAARPDDPPAPPQAAPPAADWRRTIHPDDVLLFRYSALTFNGHRIHYDRRYVLEVEAYPGLVVHGPLIATLLTDLLRRHVDRPLTRFAFRAVRPLFDTTAFAICGSRIGTHAALWAQDSEGQLAMTATADFTD